MGGEDSFGARARCGPVLVLGLPIVGISQTRGARVYAEAWFLFDILRDAFENGAAALGEARRSAGGGRAAASGQRLDR